jgi:tyrosinase
MSTRGDLAPEERRKWIDAVLCLQSTPSKLDQARYPGAKSRYDDFVVVHMNQTLSIHGTVRTHQVTPLHV